MFGKFTLGQLVAPVPERAFRELHDVAFVHDRDALALEGDRILDGGTKQTLATFLGGRFDADPRGLREADFLELLRKIFLQQIEKLAAVGRARLEFDAGVDVLGILAEDHHVDFARGEHR